MTSQSPAWSWGKNPDEDVIVSDSPLLDGISVSCHLGYSSGEDINPKLS